MHVSPADGTSVMNMGEQKTCQSRRQ